MCTLLSREVPGMNMSIGDDLQHDSHPCCVGWYQGKCLVYMWIIGVFTLSLGVLYRRVSSLHALPWTSSNQDTQSRRSTPRRRI